MASPDGSTPTADRFWPLVWAVAVGLFAALLMVIMWPPFNVPEAAFVFLAPIILWATHQPRWRLYLVTVWSAHALAWLITLIWLRHVTFIGTLFVAALLAVFPMIWAAAARYGVPRLRPHPWPLRLLAMAGLAGLWVVLEWVRTWFFFGFPWNILAVSQWERPLMLQMAAVTGPWAISFVLVFFNLGIALYVRQLLAPKGPRKWHQRLCPEFYAALLLLGAHVFALNPLGVMQQQRQPLFSAGIVQPYIPQDEKWDRERALAILATIDREATILSALDPDVIFLPESVLPGTIPRTGGLLEWLEDRVAAYGVPMVLGAQYWEDGAYYNSALVVRPDQGLQAGYYAKRELVPFGEFVPFRRFIPFIDKLVPFEGEFTPGEEPALLPLRLENRAFRLGPLICYEDVFPALARRTVAAGADFLFVATNNAWYGEEAGAYQHAAHSVLRAVETRRPVIRAGNGGWSGWIDEFGNVRHILLHPERAIYHRGAGVLQVDRDARWINRTTFYVRWGDWFVLVAVLLTGLGIAVVRLPPPRPRTPEDSLRARVEARRGGDDAFTGQHLGRRSRRR